MSSASYEEIKAKLKIEEKDRTLYMNYSSVYDTAQLTHHGVRTKVMTGGRYQLYFPPGVDIEDTVRKYCYEPLIESERPAVVEEEEEFEEEEEENTEPVQEVKNVVDAPQEPVPEVETLKEKGNRKKKASNNQKRKENKNLSSRPSSDRLSEQDKPRNNDRTQNAEGKPKKNEKRQLFTSIGKPLHSSTLKLKETPEKQRILEIMHGITHPRNTDDHRNRAIQVSNRFFDNLAKPEYSKEPVLRMRAPSILVDFMIEALASRMPATMSHRTFKCKMENYYTMDILIPIPVKMMFKCSGTDTMILFFDSNIMSAKEAQGQVEAILDEFSNRKMVEWYVEKPDPNQFSNVIQELEKMRAIFLQQKTKQDDVYIRMMCMGDPSSQIQTINVLLNDLKENAHLRNYTTATVDLYQG